MATRAEMARGGEEEGREGRERMGGIMERSEIERMVVEGITKGWGF